MTLQPRGKKLVQKPSRRSVYFLTIWQERPGETDRPAVWRYSLEDVHTGQKRGFGSLEQMLVFLHELMAEKMSSL
jgi:hypothetical protein